jgi:hypothetical protein
MNDIRAPDTIQNDVVNTDKGNGGPSCKIE